VHRAAWLLAGCVDYMKEEVENTSCWNIVTKPESCDLIQISSDKPELQSTAKEEIGNKNKEQ